MVNILLETIPIKNAGLSNMSVPLDHKIIPKSKINIFKKPSVEYVSFDGLKPTRSDVRCLVKMALIAKNIGTKKPVTSGIHNGRMAATFSVD